MTCYSLLTNNSKIHYRFSVERNMAQGERMGSFYGNGILQPYLVIYCPYTTARIPQKLFRGTDSNKIAHPLKYYDNLLNRNLRNYYE